MKEGMNEGTKERNEGKERRKEGKKGRGMRGRNERGDGIRCVPRLCDVM